MILTINIDLDKLPPPRDARTLVLMDVLHQLAHEVANIGNHVTSTIPVLSRHGGGPGSLRVGEWQIHYDDGVDS